MQTELNIDIITSFSYYVIIKPLCNNGKALIQIFAIASQEIQAQMLIVHIKNNIYI